MSDSAPIYNIIDKIVKELDLAPHPEGGFFKEVHRTEEQVKRVDGPMRAAGTGIYFLLPEGICTNWHRVDSDETWHFYAGDELVLEIIDEEGDFQRINLHDEFREETTFRFVVPHNCWQRAYSTGKYSLVGCTVAPGFEFDDFEMIEPEELALNYPEIATTITLNPFERR